MKTLAKFFIENSKLTIVLSIGLVVYGIMGLQKMNSESFPAVSLATATIVTPYDGASAEDVETKITKPIEDEIRGVSGLKDVRSTSQAGLSTIVVQVDIDNPRVDVDDVMDEVQKAVDRTNDLPTDLRESPAFTEINSEEFPVLELAVVGSNENRQRDKIADILKEEIEDNKSVKAIRLVGFAERAFKISLDLEKMEAKHISMDEVLSKVRSRNTNTPGGALRTERTQKLVRLEGKVRNIEELQNLVVRSNFSGETIRLRDIADVVDGEDEITTRARYNGAPATLLVVSKKGGADTISVVDDIFSKVDAFSERYKDYQFAVYNNEGVKVKNRVEVLVSNAVTGLILVVVFLFFFLPGKIGMAASLSLPLAIMGTLGIMPLFGMNIDAITVLALVIAIGMLVDNSVVISENFTRLKRSGMSSLEAASVSVKNLWLPITATAFTTIAAFLPMLVTKGVMGQFIKWIPIVVTIALLISLAESFFFLPMRLTFAGGSSEEKDESTGDWFSKFERKFESLMSVVVRRRYLISLLFGGLLAFSLYMMVGANKFILFPAEQTEVYITRVEFPKGTRLTQSNAHVKDLSERIKNVLGDDALHVVGRAGVSQTDLTDPKAQEGNNVGMLMIYVSENAKLNIPHTEILKKLRTIKPDYVTSLSFEALINGPPVGNPIEVTFRSNSESEMLGMIDAITKELKDVPGVKDLKVNDVIGDDEVYIEIDYQAADRLGLDVSNIGTTVRAAVSGNRIATVTLDNKDVDLIVRFLEPSRKNISDLSAIKIRDIRGNLVSLGKFATFKQRDGSPHIKRFDFKRAKTLTGEVDEEVITSVKANAILKDLYDKNQDQFVGVSMVFGGAQESTNESVQSLFQALTLSLIGIFALLVFLFKSYLRPFIIMTTIPLGLFGFSVAFFLHGRPISFLALIGIIGLGGIIVNSGIVLISFIDQMKAEGKLSLEEILVKASGMRFRAVLVTSLTTVSGLLPTAYGIGGNDAILIPMTMAMAWGLTSGTILTLIWVPAAYAILEDFDSLIKRVFESITSKRQELVEVKE